MATIQDFEIPDFDALLGDMASQVDTKKRPLLIAMLERVAAAKYREWAEDGDHRARRTELLGCAAREEEIATKIEALYPKAQALQQEIAEAMPALAQVPEDLFGGRSVIHQMAVLAAGERSGGRLWADLAKAEKSADAREAMESCGPLEDANAEVLEGILRDH